MSSYLDPALNILENASTSPLHPGIIGGHQVYAKAILADGRQQ